MPKKKAAAKPTIKVPKRIKAKKKGGKPKIVPRYEVRVQVKIPHKVWWVGVIDKKDDCHMSLDRTRVSRIFYAWYREHMKQYPGITHTPCMFSNGLVDLKTGEIYNSGDPVLMLVQVSP